MFSVKGLGFGLRLGFQGLRRGVEGLGFKV
jgi:hypothetical protein